MPGLSSKSSKKTSQKPNPSDSLFFLRNLLENLIDKRDSYDLRASFILLISSLMFLISLTNLFNQNLHKGTVSFLVITVTSLFAAVFALLTLRPPKIFQRWHKKNPTLMHHSNLSQMDYQTLARKLKGVIESNDRMTEQYMMAIHHITELAIMRKKKFLIPATNFLVVGLILSMILIFYLP